MKTSTIVGWVILVSSWIVPLFIKDKSNKRIIGLALAALATGVFIGELLF